MFFSWLTNLLSKILLFTGKIGSSRVFSFEKKLSPEKEKEYFARIKSAKAVGKSDPEAEEILTRRNLRLVAHIAKKYSSAHSDSDDLISIGSIGLIKAVRTFDPDKCKRFSSYASICIENEILMVLRKEKKLSFEVSIDTPLGSDPDGNELTIADTLFDSHPDLETQTDRSTALKKVIDIAKANLSPREYQILELRFGLNGNLPQTQKQVSKKLDISRSYISRIETTAIQKISSIINS